ncbi:hypothetical protein AB0B94_31245 [Micromonospora sp. NPDC048986]|uniref:hypothetical protein n=1 Tax=Micromonospora sp. NPDC048986 TaxID=3155644 RepID=UPI003404D840
MGALTFDPNPTLLFRADLSDLAEQYGRYARSLDKSLPGWHTGDLHRLAPALRREALMRRSAKVRRELPPEPMGCRWCGESRRGHGQSYVAGRGYHGYTEPTRAQVNARLRVKLAANRKPTPTTKEA